MKSTRLLTITAVAVSVTLAVAACASGASTGSGGQASEGTSTLSFAAFVPFSGADASYGDLALSGCYPAVYLINQAGGVLGHKFDCTSSDTRGDPVDAVPAANALVAGAGNVAAVFGPSSDEALSTVPLLSQAKIPTFLMAGLSQYNRNTNPFVWRLTPPDAAEGYAMAAEAQAKGYRRAAAVFATGTASQSDAPASKSGFTKLGGNIVADVSLTPGQPSYNTEVAKVVAAKPDVIFFTAPADTAATFFSELKQQGAIPPVYTVEVAEEPNWVSSVSGAIGPDELKKNFVAFEVQTPTNSSPGFATFSQALMTSPKKVPNVDQYAKDPFTLSFYDAANLVALSMLKAKSTDPQKFNGEVSGITQPGAAKTVVHDFKSGAAAIKAGKQIQYVGATGLLTLDRYHNVAGNFVGLTVGSNPTQVSTVPPNLVSRAES